MKSSMPEPRSAGAWFRQRSSQSVSEAPAAGRLSRPRRFDRALLLAADTVEPRDVRRLDREIVVPAPLDETFAFFADAANLQRITPPWLHFSILTPMPVRMQTGLEIEYRISLYGLPLPWRTRIDVWQPGVCFVDRQIVGPYRWWRHEHRFEAVPAGTRVIDRLDYAPRLGWLSASLVRRDIGRIFDYRHEALRRIFQR